MNKIKKRYLTIFPKTENVHLLKDVGMIPYLLYKNEGWESTIACYENGEYPYLQNEVKGLNIIFIKRIFNNEQLDSIWFILTHFWKYDVLQTYHFLRYSLVICFLFKLLNLGKAKTYIKMDANDGVMSITLTGFTKWMYFALAKTVDVITVETSKIYDYLSKNWSIKVEYVPNGFYDNGKRKDTAYAEKENLILSVGRIGDPVKSNDTLCEAFALFWAQNKEWKLKFVGPITKEFETYIEDFLRRNPHINEAIEFVGPVYDKQRLMNYYQKAKIFVHTSLFESFGLVYLEAMQSGCYIISSEITPAYDLTDHQRFGKLFKVKDIEGLATCLRNVTLDADLLQSNTPLVQQFVYSNFYWPVIVSKINTLLAK